MLDPDGALWLLSEHAPVKVDVSQWNGYVIIARQSSHPPDQRSGHLRTVRSDDKRRTLEGLLAIHLHRGNANSVEIQDLRLKVPPETPLVPFDPAKLHATATKIEKPRTSRPQGTGPVVPVKK